MPRPRQQPPAIHPTRPGTLGTLLVFDCFINNDDGFSLHGLSEHLCAEALSNLSDVEASPAVVFSCFIPTGCPLHQALTFHR